MESAEAVVMGTGMADLVAVTAGQVVPAVVLVAVTAHVVVPAAVAVRVVVVRVAEVGLVAEGDE